MESIEISAGDEKPEEDFFGPALPPHLLKKKNAIEDGTEQKIIGPVLPEGFGGKNEEAPSDSNDKNLIGPEVPEGFNIPQQEGDDASSDPDEDEDVGFGPSTALMTTGDVDPSYKFRVAQTSKRESEEESNVTKRESWMTELPDKKTASLGLFPRHFKTRVQTDKESDSSVWTDTPAEKKRKEEGHGKKRDHKEELKAKMLEERNKEMEKLARKAAKKLRKKESLLEMHQKNMKKKKKKEAKKREKEGKVVPERRPFDRDIDLKIQKIDENQRRAILNKSQFLNDRFASGQSKFL